MASYCWRERRSHWKRGRHYKRQKFLQSYTFFLFSFEVFFSVVISQKIWQKQLVSPNVLFTYVWPSISSFAFFTTEIYMNNLSRLTRFASEVTPIIINFSIWTTNFKQSNANVFFTTINTSRFTVTSGYTFVSSLANNSITRLFC